MKNLLYEIDDQTLKEKKKRSSGSSDANTFDVTTNYCVKNNRNLRVRFKQTIKFNKN